MSLLPILNTRLSENTNGFNTSPWEGWFCAKGKDSGIQTQFSSSGDADFPWGCGAQPRSVQTFLSWWKEQPCIYKCVTELGHTSISCSTSLLSLGTWCAFNLSAPPFNLHKIKTRIHFSSRVVLYLWTASLQRTDILVLGWICVCAYECVCLTD